MLIQHSNVPRTSSEKNPSAARQGDIVRNTEDERRIIEFKRNIGSHDEDMNKDAVQCPDSYPQTECCFCGIKFFHRKSAIRPQDNSLIAPNLSMLQNFVSNTAIIWTISCHIFATVETYSWQQRFCESRQLHYRRVTHNRVPRLVSSSAIATPRTIASFITVVAIILAEGLENIGLLF